MPRRQISNIIAGRSLFSASREMTVRAASCLMAENHIGALVVVENGRIVGIFTVSQLAGLKTLDWQAPAALGRGMLLVSVRTTTGVHTQRVMMP